jgi:hypothetical protein
VALNHLFLFFRDSEIPGYLVTGSPSLSALRESTTLADEAAVNFDESFGPAFSTRWQCALRKVAVGLVWRLSIRSFCFQFVDEG